MQSRNKYALKIVSKSTLVKPRAEQKLRSEIRIHRTLNHPNIVRFERYFEDGLNAYLLLELCMNNSMSDLMKRRKKLVEFEARYYLVQIINSLKYLHQHKVIHRDLKLGNLFIDHRMQIKVGDFGLATKLSHVDERKKTVCGTPNYIAPEILEGKNGHSFEVDIWSTGVILFTLLCGKPPFEAKDVKSTYKRIVANQYSFPDHTVVSPEAKELIRHMLQPRAERRPTLDQCLHHTFFTGPQAYCPSSLEDSCMREAPLVPSKSLSGASNSAFRANDENDPHAANRQQQEPLLNIKVGGSSGVGAAKEGRYPLSERPVSAGARQSSKVGSSNGPNSIVGGQYAATGSSAPASARMASMSTAPGVSGDRMPPSARSSSRPSSSSGSGAAPMGSYQQKFEIYQDGMTKNSNMQSTSGKSSTRDSYSSARASGATTREDITSSGYLSTLGSGKSSKSSSCLNEAGVTSSDAMDVVETLNVNMGQVQITTNATSTGGSSTTASAWTAESEAGIATTASTLVPAKACTPKGASIGSSHVSNKPLDTLETMHKMLNRSLHGNEAAGTTGNGYMAAHANGHMDSPDQRAAVERSYEDEPVSANTIGITGGSLRTSEARSSSGTFRTAETETDLHNMFSNAQGQNNLRTGAVSATDLSRMTAKVWVVRYVDYTSKYGLGFLLNTGSAGVYFNDSTKIVLSADGTMFQYVERRRREAGHSSSSSSEHTSQTHLMEAYPQELQKKVTLLRHFRNYLVDQQRAYCENDDNNDGNAAAGNAPNMPAVLPESSNSGATSTIRFGVSSAKFDARNAVEMGLCADGTVEAMPYAPIMGADGKEKDSEMPFLKKWVRTRHAILFRLSNRVVQVVFFDRSEVLLSPEARVVTYVNKTGSREEHSLEEVLHSGRSDIAKRLKYTKDIIWRLINVNGGTK